MKSFLEIAHSWAIDNTMEPIDWSQFRGNTKLERSLFFEHDLKWRYHIVCQSFMFNTNNMVAPFHVNDKLPNTEQNKTDAKA